VVALVGVAVVASPADAKEQHGKAKLPDAVAKAFTAAFPKGEIATVDAEKEAGVEVYDIEFTEGGLEQECDITADGVILEASAVVEAQTVPGAAMNAIKAAADGGTIRQIEKAEIRAEVHDGKITKLDPFKTQFEAELRKGDQRAEITVDENGAVVEAPEWVKAAKHGKEGNEERD
jgi:uncharacterized membrane protein YkoI